MSIGIYIPGVNDKEENTKQYPFPLNQWYIADFGWKLTDKPIARTLLNHSIVLFRDGSGKACALENRCCHRSLPLSDGTVEDGGLRCGYHGLLFDGEGHCLEVPGQAKIPRKAKVKKYNVLEQDDIIWMWFGSEENSEPTCLPPSYDIHSSGKYLYDGDLVHYKAPYQLIHDNLLDLSHLGYVHLKTIGGDAKTHMNADTKVSTENDTVTVKRYMMNSKPAPTYTAAYPFKGNIDRWQQIEFAVSHLKIWTGAVDVNSESVESPNRGGFHMRGFHGITPETETTSHYFWSMASNPSAEPEETMKKIIDQTAFTFDEDKVIIESQYKNMCKFGDNVNMVDVHIDVGPNHARKIIERLRNK